MDRKDFVLVFVYKDTSVYSWGYGQVYCTLCKQIRNKKVEDWSYTGSCHGLTCSSYIEFDNRIHYPVITRKECNWLECPNINNCNACIIFENFKVKRRVN